MNDKLNTKKLVIFAFYLLLFTLLFAENNMELMTEIVADTINTELGSSVAALDFNGDGIDDLAVTERWWSPGYIQPSLHHGRVLLYFGKVDCFGDSADIEITTCSYNTQFPFNDSWVQVRNLGDLNNDGFEDIGFNGQRFDEQLNFLNYAGILLGGNPCDTIPDYIFEFQTPDYENRPELHSLGDINGDGFDDAGIGIERYDGQEYYWEYGIVYGNDFQYVSFCQTVDGGWSPLINGIGDINSDSFDDFVLWYEEDDEYITPAFLGDTVNVPIPDFYINDYVNSIWWNNPGSAYCGDWNGDGFDDFVATSHYDLGIGLWFGENGNFEPGADIYIEFYSGHRGFNSFGFGDFNNDGFSDITIGFPELNSYNGGAYVYLGSQNGTVDLIIPGEWNTLMGWGVAIGDFNNDGYDDLALGGPGEFNQFITGRVRVYAGNPQLEEADPNISVEENNIPPSNIEFNAYPNPFNPNTTIKLELAEAGKIELTIYNIKGQKVKTLLNCTTSPGTYECNWNGKDESGKSVSSGQYVVKLEQNERETATKIILLK